MRSVNNCGKRNLPQAAARIRVVEALYLTARMIGVAHDPLIRVEAAAHESALKKELGDLRREHGLALRKAAQVKSALASQRRRKEAGLCVTCGEKAVDGWHCRPHKSDNAERVRNRQRRLRGIPLDAPLRGKGEELQRRSA